MYSIFITRKIPQCGIDLLKKECHVEINPYDRPLTKNEIIESLKKKDGLLCLLNDKIDGEIICSNPSLRVISNYAVGYNNIDIKRATEKNIAVTNTPGVLTETTADLTWACILSVARRITEGDKFARDGKFTGWEPELMLGIDIYGKTLGIIGCGRIGKAVARRAVGFNMNVLYNNRTKLTDEEEKSLNISYASMDEILKISDFITLHVPLTKDTEYLIREKELNIMKKSAFLINTSRGEVIDEKALLKALTDGTIKGAALDVFEHEPAITEGLKELKNVVLLPHIGSATVETRSKMAIMAAENLLAGLKGDVPTNIVNREIYNS